MTALITDKFRVYNAKQFLESFDEAVGTEHFFFVGRSKDWGSVVEFYGQLETAPAPGTTITLDPGGVALTAVISSVYEGAWVVTGLDPAVANGLEFSDDITWTSPGAGSAKLLKVRPATEDAPLRPLDNLNEKYDYYREIIAAKRIYNTTRGDSTGTSPDDSYVSAVVNRLDYGINSDFTSRTTPYDMWRPNYASTPNFTRLSQGSTGEAGVANLEMVTRNSGYEVFLCIDNKFDSATGTGTIPDAVADGPRTTGTTTTVPAQPGTYCTADGVFTTLTGQKWKYLYTLNTTDVLRFQSQRFIPLRDFAGVSITGPEVASVLDPGSGWTDGTYYTPVNGDGQVSDDAYKVVEFIVTSGAITSARVILSSESGKTDTDYTYASVDISQVGSAAGAGEEKYKYGVFTDAGLTTPAAAVPTNTGGNSPGHIEVVVPPQGGYGSSENLTFQEQLNAKRVMCNIRLTFDEGAGDFPVTNDFRRIGLLRDPKQYDGSDIDLNTETIRNTYAIHFNAATVGAGDWGPNNFVPDEEISQTLTTTNGATVVAKGTVVEWLPVDSNDVESGGILRYYQDPILHSDNGQIHSFHNAAGGLDDIASAGNIVGSVSAGHDSAQARSIRFGNAFANQASTSGALNTEAGTTLDPVLTGADLYPEIQPYSGEIIYVENRRLITRAADQIEDIKLVIEF